MILYSADFLAAFQIDVHALSHLPPRSRRQRPDRVHARRAYDVDRGRLWIVCPSCGEWNLTPVEERWEAIETCERHFRGVDVCRATAVDQAEEHAADRERRGGAVRPAWTRIAAMNWPSFLDQLALMPRIPRLALEMAVSEELERRALAGDAGSLAQRWRDAEEVAAIADNMFLPASITDWLARRSRRVGS